MVALRRSFFVAGFIAVESGASNISAGVPLDICGSQHSLHCSGQDIKRINYVHDHETCCNACKATSGCKAWSWGWNYPEKWCTIKSGCDTQQRDPNVHSGVGGSPSPPPPTPPTPPAPRGSKKGFCHKHLSGRDADALAGAGASWYHNWGIRPDSGTSRLGFHPTVWGRDQMHELTSLAHDSVLLGFNEPNMDHSKGGSQMSVSECARDWPQVEAAAKQIGATTLVAPQLAWVHPNQWYDQFFAECHGCKDRLQGVSAHIYNCDLHSLKYFVSLFRKYGKPLWITEMACAGKSAAENCAYIREAFPYLDSDDAVAGYAWFSEGSTALASGGRLTEIGKCFADHASNWTSSPAEIHV